MFRKKEEPSPNLEPIPLKTRITSILGEGSSWKGEISGSGGIRIEGLCEGLIDLDGLIIVDQKGRVESDLIKADTVIVAGAVRSNIQAKKVEIRSTGRVWGDVTTVKFSTEEGAYLRGKIQMEEEEIPEGSAEQSPDEERASLPELKPKKTTD
ncbi:MAG TPA: polymer-forming cytoskeletal protein [Chloroflexi bacterium]|nr:MAG: polymer-forming cytoskeletal protein [Chloroflexota bacterium]HDD56180.1 polymer-forming cytoskeletal protein [Chloroflexota bacterium]